MPVQTIPANPRDILTGTAILVFCGTVTLYFPVLGFICFFFMPLPAAFYRVRLGRTAGGAMLAVSMVIILALGSGTGHAVDLWLIFCMLALGYAMGDALERRLSFEKTVAWSCLPALGAAFAVLAFMGSLSGIGPWQMISDYVYENLEMTAAAYENMNLTDGRIELLIQSPGRVHDSLMGIMPALAVSGMIFSSWANLLLARPALKAGGMMQANFGKLNRWKAPDGLVWAVIACGVLLLASDARLSYLGLNGLIMLMLVYLFQGIAVVSYYFETRQVPMFLRVMVYVFFVLQQVFALFVIGLGFFDIWADFRRLGADGGEDQDSSY